MGQGDAHQRDRERKTVLIYESVVIDQPFPELATRLRGDEVARHSLAEAAADAFAVGVAGQGRFVLGTARARREAVVLPVLWEAAITPGTIETFDGDLQVAPFGDARSHLSFSASHRTARSGETSDRPSALVDAETRVRLFLSLIERYFAAHPRD